VALIYSTTPDAEAKVYEVASENKVTCRAYRSNVTDPKAIEATIKRIAKDFGKLDILVANAGIAGEFEADFWLIPTIGQ
jgi:sorbose reductase